MPVTEQLLSRAETQNFSLRNLGSYGDTSMPETEIEPTYALPGGISGTMKELLADPTATTNSISSAQAVMRNLYKITLVDDTSRQAIDQRAVRTRMGIVLDIFKPKERKGSTPSQISGQAEKTAKSMIKTAATIYNHGISDLVDNLK